MLPTSMGKFYRFIIGKLCGVLQRLIDVLSFQIRIGLQNLLPALTGSEKPEQSRHGKPHAANAWLASTDCWINGDAG